jgi:plastocyanin
MSGRMHRPAKAAQQVAAALLCCIAIWVVAGSAHADGKNHVVTIEAMQYVPQTIEVNTGDTIVWENKDAFPHTATAVGRSFDSGSIGSDRTWKLKVRTKGTFPYVCTLHPTMKATLVVK